MTASTADYYGILGLTSDATLADVKKAYRKLARQHHPDRNNADPGAIDRFRRITEAYEYLSAHLKDNAHGNGYSGPGPAPRGPTPACQAGTRRRPSAPANPRSRPSSSSPAAPPAGTPDGAASTPSGGPSTPPAP